MLIVLKLSDTPVTFTGLTTTLQVERIFRLLLTFTAIIAVPSPTAVTSPVEETIAIFSSPEVHSTSLFVVLSGIIV